MPYYGYIRPDVDLAKAYIVIAQVREAYIARGRPDLAARAQKVFDELNREFAKLSRDVAAESIKLIRAHINATQTRPSGSPRQSQRIAPAVYSRAGKPIVPGLNGGEVDIGDLARLDQAAVDPKYAKSGEYWRAQEYGTDAHVGRLVRGFFTDARGGGGARYRPHPGDSRNHPYFEAVRPIGTSSTGGPRYPKGTPGMLIRRPIEARHFMRDGFNDAVSVHRVRAQALMDAAAVRLP